MLVIVRPRLEKASPSDAPGSPVAELCLYPKARSAELFCEVVTLLESKLSVPATFLSPAVVSAQVFLVIEVICVPVVDAVALLVAYHPEGKATADVPVPKLPKLSV
jgi:hypothetical protein